MFDEFLGAHYADDETYAEVTRDGLLDSAAAFEPIVRAGIARVTGARMKQRTGAPDVQLALELARPLFCDESVNYVSEVHASGELRSHALVDDSLRSLYRTVAVDGGWTWLRDTRIELPVPGTGESPVTLIPVRGEATIAAELGLVARGVLDARTRARDRLATPGAERAALHAVPRRRRADRRRPGPRPRSDDGGPRAADRRRGARGVPAGGGFRARRDRERRDRPDHARRLRRGDRSTPSEREPRRASRGAKSPGLQGRHGTADSADLP
jgi:hypothetical protein